MAYFSDLTVSMFFHHSRTSLSCKLSLIFVFGLVCATFAAAMPLSSDKPAVSIPPSNVNPAIIPKRDLNEEQVTITFEPGHQEPLALKDIQDQIEDCLKLVASKLGFTASVSEWREMPNRRSGMVHFIMKSGPLYYSGQLHDTASTAKDPKAEKHTRFILQQLNGEYRGRNFILASDGSAVKVDK
ncbi:hypothetical protein F5051DRAFT_431134 [Lentinula edodes]|nr:hypothetical protein F5051DRAFT_431134 [Lentinula edodes]